MAQEVMMVGWKKKKKELIFKLILFGEDRFKVIEIGSEISNIFKLIIFFWRRFEIIGTRSEIFKDGK